MNDNEDQGGEAPCWAHLFDDGRESDDPPPVSTSNTILYVEHWADVVHFYREGLGLRATMERDWFVEFEVHPGVHVSVADARRASIPAGHGAGLTLSWRTGDAATTRRLLIRKGIDASPVANRWGSPGFFVIDPAGNRIEFWSPSR